MAQTALDSTLAQLRQTVAVMSTNLVALETDATRTRLDQTPLQGATAARWADARAALSCLWQWFTQLNDILETATKVRGTRPRAEPGQQAQLESLVNGPSIELSTADVPLAQRGLFGPSETTIRCSPPQLLDRMRVAFDQVVAVIGTCSQRWSALDATLHPLEVQLAEADRLAADIGERHHPELDRARSDLARLRETAMVDPLGWPDPTAGASAVATCLASVTDDLRRLAQLRDNLAQRLSEGQALMADLRSTTAVAAAARADALDKIAEPAVIDPRAVADNLGAGLDRVVESSSQGDWRAADNQLVQWTTRCQDALADARRALTANQAPVAARDELRGRLEAYRAKANRIGLLEDPAAEALYARAKKVLWTAPTNLAEAEQLVRHYQRLLTGPAPREVAQ